MKSIYERFTHPIDEIRFFFPDKPSDFYHLGKDSEMKGEFWLTIDARLGRVFVKHFTSESLDEWLRKNLPK